MKTKCLVVVDMQNDFIDGALGSENAQAIVDNVCEKIKNFDGKIFLTKDTHDENEYLSTLEGKLLPVPHCLAGNPGHNLNQKIEQAIGFFLNQNAKSLVKIINKNTFGSLDLPDIIVELTDASEIEICGLCTDICVVSNALILRAAFPDVPMKCDSSCCAGTTPENHDAALKVMRSCQIEII